MTLIYQIEGTDEEAKKIVVKIGEMLGIGPEITSDVRIPHDILMQTAVESSYKVKNEGLKTTKYPHLKISKKAI